MRNAEEVLWNSRPKMSIPLILATVAGVTILLISAYSRIIFPKLSPNWVLILFGVSVFVTMPSWQYFLNLGSHYYVTNQRVVITRNRHAIRELGFDNIEHIDKYEGFTFGSWHVQFIAADGSDIDGCYIDGKPARWVMGFDYLW